MRSGVMSPLAKYTMGRLALFVVVLGLVAALGARGPLALALAVVISMLASYVLLRGLREQASEAVAQRVSNRLEEKSRRIGSRDSEIEDAEIDRGESAGAGE